MGFVDLAHKLCQGYRRSNISFQMVHQISPSSLGTLRCYPSWCCCLWCSTSISNMGLACSSYPWSHSDVRRNISLEPRDIDFGPNQLETLFRLLLNRRRISRKQIQLSLAHWTLSCCWVDCNEWTARPSLTDLALSCTVDSRLLTVRNTKGKALESSAGYACQVFDSSWEIVQDLSWPSQR